MKTASSKAIKRPINQSTIGETTKKKQGPGKEHEPSEVEIRELAEIIFHQRIERGANGTAEEDWLKAEEYLSHREV